MSHALVIGASSGIAQALLSQLADLPDVTQVHAVSRTSQSFSNPSITSFSFNTLDEEDVKAFITEQREQGVTYRYVVSTVGVLHRDENEHQIALKPEKRLEDIDPKQLQSYFEVNTILPAIWLKHLIRVMPKGMPSVIAFLSARVGSISDNRLGGWYGYRASKAALNMMIKNAAIEYARRNKHVALMSYHPGTVDTGLSKPFQANVKADKLFTPEYTAQCLIQLLVAAEAANSPYYLGWDGKTIPW
jgi:NAD(P)-dependent dehydrogenase (short-subunit alcohol dehydrogenase family)